MTSVIFPWKCSEGNCTVISDQYQQKNGEMIAISCSNTSGVIANFTISAGGIFLLKKQTAI